MTPAVLVAVGLPAGVASVVEPGGIALADTAASMTDMQLGVTATVGYVGDGQPLPDQPVDPVEVRILVASDRVSGPAEILTALWTATAPVSDGTTTTYLFTWIGGALSADNPATLPLTVKIHKSASIDPLSVTVQATGMSNGSSVPPANWSALATIVADLVLNTNPAIRYQQDTVEAEEEDYEPEPIYAFDGSTRWAGPYWPEGATATLIRVTARVPVENSTGVLIEQFVGSGWEKTTPAPVLVAGAYQIVYEFDQPLTSTLQNTSTLQFALGLIGVPVIDVAVLQTEGLSAGVASKDLQTGPKSLLEHAWTGMQYLERHADPPGD